MEGPIIGDNQPTEIFRRMTVANNMVEMERHPLVHLPSAAPTKLQRLEMRLRRQQKSRDKSRNSRLANP
jgi:hypothetical protein